MSVEATRDKWIHLIRYTINKHPHMVCDAVQICLNCLAHDAEWQESKHPRDKDGRFESGNGEENPGKNLTPNTQNNMIRSSPKRTNKFSRGFSPHNLAVHWTGASSHRAQYPGMTKEQYAEAALELIQQPVGGDIHGYANSSGQIVRYNAKTNDFVKGHPQRGIATMFKPTDGRAYYERQRRKEEVR